MRPRLPRLPDPSLLKQRQHVWEMVQGVLQAHILVTRFDVGVFEALGGRPATAAEVATAIEADARGVEPSLNAASALGLLEKREGRFGNTVLAETCLVSGGPEP